jgi:hypothetical protein
MRAPAPHGNSASTHQECSGIPARQAGAGYYNTPSTYNHCLVPPRPLTCRSATWARLLHGTLKYNCCTKMPRMCPYERQPQPAPTKLRQAHARS